MHKTFLNKSRCINYMFKVPIDNNNGLYNFY